MLILTDGAVIERKDMNVDWVTEHCFRETELQGFLVDHDGGMFFTVRKNRVATEKVSLNIERAWLVKHFRLEILTSMRQLMTRWERKVE